MRGSLTIGRIRGVPLRLHWSFLLLLVVIGALSLSATGSLQRAAYTMGIIVLIFVFVLLHELAHVAVARRHGIPTREITLLPIGGISHMERIPEDPKKEAQISVAGPLVNLALALAIAPIAAHLHGGWGALAHPSLIDASDPVLLIDMVWLNVLMGAFNLLPAFPLDGGRVLRALLATRLHYVQATKLAADVGKIFGIFFVLAGLFVWPNIFLAIIGIFVYLGAGAEERGATALAVFKDGRVDEAMQVNAATTTPETPVSALVARGFSTQQTDFPVLHHGHLVGLVDRSHLRAASGHAHLLVADVMKRPAPTVHADDDLATAFELFRSAGVKAIAVVPARLGTTSTGSAAQAPMKESAATPMPAQAPPAQPPPTRDRWAPGIRDTASPATAAGRSRDPAGGSAAGGASHVADGSAGDPRPLAGMLTVEDMERAFLWLTHRDAVGKHARVASPMQPFERRRRLSGIPRAHHTRRAGRRPGSAPEARDREVWVPVVSEDEPEKRT